MIIKMDRRMRRQRWYYCRILDVHGIAFIQLPYECREAVGQIETPEWIVLLADDGWNESYHHPKYYDQRRGTFVIATQQPEGWEEQLQRVAEQAQSFEAELDSERYIHARAVLWRRGMWRDGD